MGPKIVLNFRAFKKLFSYKKDSVFSCSKSPINERDVTVFDFECGNVVAVDAAAVVKVKPVTRIREKGSVSMSGNEHYTIFLSPLYELLFDLTFFALVFRSTGGVVYA